VLALHQDFLDRALPLLAEDPDLVGVAAGGSLPAGALDEFSDLDLVIAVEPGAYEAVIARRRAIAARLGPLLAAFTGEHVGEPRLLICLFGPPLLHVDLKFVALPDVAARVEEPAVLWEREGRLSAALVGEARFPPPDGPWIEDRFWIWVHYGAAKIGRGELFEAIDMIDFLRKNVLGPLALARAGARPMGVRRIERAAPAAARAMEATIAKYDRASCIAALRAAADLYRALRAGVAPQQSAERAALDYLDEVGARPG
jgi:hypothetical protein